MGYYKMRIFFIVLVVIVHVMLISKVIKSIVRWLKGSDNEKNQNPNSLNYTGMQKREEQASSPNSFNTVQQQNDYTSVKNMSVASKKSINMHKDFSNNEIRIANKKCPYCGNNLRSRTNSYDGTYFLGCSMFGKTGCDFTINYVDYHEIVNKYKS